MSALALGSRRQGEEHGRVDLPRSRVQAFPGGVLAGRSRQSQAWTCFCFVMGVCQAAILGVGKYMGGRIGFRIESVYPLVLCLWWRIRSWGAADRFCVVVAATEAALWSHWGPLETYFTPPPPFASPHFHSTTGCTILYANLLLLRDAYCSAPSMEMGSTKDKGK